MDEATREYLDAINKMVGNTTPQQPPLSDEVVWLEMFKTVAMSPKSHLSFSVSLELADFGLNEFRKRFRDNEESN
jgi:hypothetical protein